MFQGDLEKNRIKKINKFPESMAKMNLSFLLLWRSQSKRWISGFYILLRITNWTPDVLKQQLATKKKGDGTKQIGILLTSSSDFNSSNNLSLDVAGEEGPGEVEAGNNNLGNSVTLTGEGAAGKGVLVELPLYGSASVNNQRAAVSNDTRGWHRRSQRHHQAGCLDLCTWLHAFL